MAQITQEQREKSPFQVGKIVPKIWVHMEFDFNDTSKYLGDVKIRNQKEADKLTKKYWI